MEGNMVENNSKQRAEDFNNIVIDYFRVNLPHFTLINETNYGPYWGVSLADNNGIVVRVRGEYDGFDIVIDIGIEEFPLWKIDRAVIYATDANRDNILLQLSILKSFLDNNANAT